ncbi:MAG: hypothetical protein LC804_14450 [Acidobacteria bacterium]|nr:hypothetical protein [Acidobacteriota bacterium]
MEQRPLRLGDILDDYCPRERRVTNHAVVAMIEENVKQTRCTTCDAEHAYKGAKVPRRRRKESPAGLYKEVLAGMPDAENVPVLAAPSALAPTNIDDTEIAASDVIEIEAADAVEDGPGAPTPSDDMHDDDHDGDNVEASGPPEVEEGPVHRQLIRAQLPRIEGQKDARPLPEFTVRQAAARSGGGHFRGGDPRTKPRGGRPDRPGANGNGNRIHGGPRFAGARPTGHGRGPASRGGPSGGGFRTQQPRQGGKKRSR